MLTVAIILIALGIAAISVVATFSIMRPAAIMRPSERYYALIALIAGGVMALCGIALLVYDLLGRYIAG